MLLVFEGCKKLEKLDKRSTENMKVKDRKSTMKRLIDFRVLKCKPNERRANNNGNERPRARRGKGKMEQIGVVGASSISVVYYGSKSGWMTCFT